MIKKLSMSLVLVTLCLFQTQAAPTTWSDTFFGNNTRKAVTLSAGLLAAGATATAVNYFKQGKRNRSLTQAGKLVFTGPWNWATKETTNKVVAGFGALLACYGLYKYFQTPEEPKATTGAAGDGAKKAPIFVDVDKNTGRPNTSRDAALAKAEQEKEDAATARRLQEKYDAEAQASRSVLARKVNVPLKAGWHPRR